MRYAEWLSGPFQCSIEMGLVWAIRFGKRYRVCTESLMHISRAACLVDGAQTRVSPAVEDCDSRMSNSTRPLSLGDSTRSFRAAGSTPPKVAFRGSTKTVETGCQSRNPSI